MSPKSQHVKQTGLFGFLAQPDEGATGSGVLILPTIFGVNGFVRGFAEALARAGLTAAVVDYYAGAALPTSYDDARATGAKLSDGAVAGMETRWFDHLAGDLRLTSLGVAGFCLGGRFSLIAAARDKRIKACAACYPSIHNPLQANQERDAVALSAGIACPVSVVEPGHDHVATPQTYAALKQNLLARSAPTIWQYYPEAEHGFMHRDAPPANPAATAVAYPQVVAFLKGCLSRSAR
jgi:carboxymethylenebutenolidase